MSDWNNGIVEEFRANEGKVEGHFTNSTLLLLHTTGANSGQSRINPLIALADGDRLAVAASKGGAPTHPDWYHNIVANPEGTVEYGTEKFKARATPAEEPERTELYAKMIENFPDITFAEYVEKTDRVIPVVTLMRIP